jgi:hypothetical protein
MSFRNSAVYEHQNIKIE